MDPGSTPATATKEGRSCVLVTGLTALLYIHTTHTTHTTRAHAFGCVLFMRGGAYDTEYKHKGEAWLHTQTRRRAATCFREDGWAWVVALVAGPTVRT